MIESEQRNKIINLNLEIHIETEKGQNDLID
jgi:hypothetical protein